MSWLASDDLEALLRDLEHEVLAEREDMYADGLLSDELADAEGECR